MPIALYARVSTDEQARNETIQNQLDFARKYAELHNLGDIEFFTDEGISGVIPLEERPGGKRLLDAVRQGIKTEVLLYRLDRLGRAARVILNAVHELEKHARVKSMTEPFDTADPTGRFLLTILAGVADLERETIKERTYAGLRRTVAKGKWPGYPPLGYRKNKSGILEPNDESINGTSFTPAGLVQLIFRLVGEQQYTTVQVAQYLNALGLPPVVHIQGMKKKNLNGWSTGYLYNIITNTVYIGERVFKSKLGEPITCEVPALISEDLWHKVQSVIKEHSRLNWYKPKYQYLLTGLIRCGLCGRIYSGRAVERYRKSGPYVERLYLCAGKRQSVNRKPCGNPNVGADRIENAVWDYILSFVENPGPHLDSLANAAPDVSGLTAETESLKELAAGKEVEKQAVLDLYRRGTISLGDVEIQVKRIGDERQALDKRIAELQAQLDQAADISVRIRELKSLLELLRDKIKNPLSWEEKRRIVLNFIKEVIVYPGDKPGQKNKIKIDSHFSVGAGDHDVFNSEQTNNGIMAHKLFNLSGLNNLRLMLESLDK